MNKAKEIKIGSIVQDFCVQDNWGIGVVIKIKQRTQNDYFIDIYWSKKKYIFTSGLENLLNEEEKTFFEVLKY